MDLGRRGLLLSLALAPALASVARAAAAASPAPGSGAVLSLRAMDGGTAPAPPWRYGEASGPTVLRLKRGAEALIRLENRLARPTSLDLHGLRVAPPLGGAGPLGGSVMPGAVADIAVVPPDAGTAWFHPWALDAGTDAAALGLAGVLVVEEPEPPGTDHDVVALLSDRPPGPPGDGPEGSTWRIGRAAPPRRESLRVGARVRLRLVNGSTRRAATVSCSGTTPLVLAIDGQPAALFRPRGGAVPLAPGGRCDLVFDMPRTAGAEVVVSVSAASVSETALVLRAEGEPLPLRDPVAALPPNPALPEAIALERATRATLAAAPVAGRADAWALNGIEGRDLPKAPLFRAKRGAPVTLAFENRSPALVGFRVHGFALRLLHDRDDGWQPFWQDTVLIGPGATHHAAFVADRAGRWLIESPFFDQAAGGLRGWFEVS